MTLRTEERLSRETHLIDRFDQAHALWGVEVINNNNLEPGRLSLYHALLHCTTHGQVDSVLLRTRTDGMSQQLLRDILIIVGEIRRDTGWNLR